MVKTKSTGYYKFLTWMVIAFFTQSTVAVPVYAQTPQMQAPVSFLPAVGTMVDVTQSFSPLQLKGIRIYENNPFLLDFVIDKGDVHLEGDGLMEASEDLVQYFLASLTVPEKDLWVNLSPYEKDRVIPDHFGQTKMGRDILAQDYYLKQLTASLLHPDKEVGQAFWDKVRAQAQQKFGVDDIPVDTFNKVWIVPDEVFIYENQDTAYILESRLKVLTEKDFLALDINERNQIFTDQPVMEDKQEDLSSDILKEVIIPALEHEVNYGEGFAQLRQVYHSLALAAWYKRHLRQGLLRHTYYDKNLIEGVDVADKDVAKKIYAQYVESFDVGVFNFVKEEYDPGAQMVIPRKYFSGGVKMDASALSPQTRRTSNPEILKQHIEEDASVLDLLTVALKPQKKGSLVSAASEGLAALSMAAVLSATPVQAQVDSVLGEAKEYQLQFEDEFGVRNTVDIPLDGNAVEFSIYEGPDISGYIRVHRFPDKGLDGKAVLTIRSISTQSYFVYLVDESLLLSQDELLGGLKNMIFIGESPRNTLAQGGMPLFNLDLYEKLIRFVWGDRDTLQTEDYVELDRYLSRYFEVYNGASFVVNDEIDEKNFPREIRGSIDQPNVSSLQLKLIPQELSFDVDRANEMEVTNLNMDHQLEGEFPGIRGYYTANLVDYPEYIVWGLVDSDGNIVRTNVARTDDDMENISKYAKLLAGLETNKKIDLNLFFGMVNSYFQKPHSNELTHTFFMNYLDIVSKYKISNFDSQFHNIMSLVLNDFSLELLVQLIEKMESIYDQSIADGDVLNKYRVTEQYTALILSMFEVSKEAALANRMDMVDRLNALYSQMVSKLVETIDYANPNFFDSMYVIANQHFYMRLGSFSFKRYETQDPQVVYNLLINWHNENDIELRPANMVGSFNDLAAELLLHLSDETQKSILTGIIVDNISKKLDEQIRLIDNLFGLIPNVMLSDRLEFFNLLSEEDKQKFIEKWVSFPINPSDLSTQGVVNFVEALISKGELTDIQQQMIRDYYKDALKDAVQGAINEGLSWRYNPRLMAAIARILGEKELLEPLIEHVTPSTHIEQVLRLWRNYGFLVTERSEGVLLEATDELNIVESFYNTIGKDIRHVDFLLEAAIKDGRGGSSGLRRFVMGGANLRTFLHELAHAVIYNIPVQKRFELQKNWDRTYNLYEQEGEQNVTDYFVTGYASTETNENEADVFVSLMIKGPNVIEKGLNVGIQNQRWGYFNSLLIIMEEFFMQQVDGREVIPVYRKNNPENYQFVPDQPVVQVAEIVIVERDDQGRISELVYEGQNYRLGYGEFDLINSIEEVDPSGLTQKSEDFVPYDVMIETDASSLIEQIEQPQRTVTPLEESKKNVGGILLDPALMRMNVTQGDGGMSVPQLTPEQIEDMSIDGIVPVMLGVQPITNPFMYLRN